MKYGPAIILGGCILLSSALVGYAAYVAPFPDGALQLLGSSSGKSTIKAPATGGGTATLPAGTGTLVYSAGGASLTVGTSTISGGVTGDILYDNSGVLGEESPSLTVNGTTCTLGTSCTPPGRDLLVVGSSTGNTFTAPTGYFVCTSTCTVTPPVSAAGYQFCVMNDDNVSTVITLGAIGSSVKYENTARTAYGTAGTGTFTSGGAVGDMVCIVGRDSTHYLTTTFKGTWVAS